ncbi:MAG TPA: hypothetical protein CFH84_05005 [Sulfurimonas sp. UBA12504]|nr:MAG: hypothetical protein A2019_05420 [Sulfurimonas sp. GWF2_37_8]DAB30280.1 MAG TPA: hypothetical protein CFH84_05005 [Sulfurimonas sp. UBA12504]
MTYKEWFDSHSIKHTTIVAKLHERGMNKKQIIDYFDFDNMVLHEREFCLLYQEDKKCHDVETLNCYLCACPHFRFDDNSTTNIEEKTEYSFCAINAKEGKKFISQNALHQDCTACLVPHSEEFISKCFDIEWQKIMDKCFHNIQIQ